MPRLSDVELKVTGIEALNKALGVVDAYRFMTLLHNENTDYIEISRRIYEGNSIDDIFERASGEWKGQNKYIESTFLVERIIQEGALSQREEFKWQVSAGTGGRFIPESLAGLGRNMKYFSFNGFLN